MRWLSIGSLLAFGALSASCGDERSTPTDAGAPAAWERQRQWRMHPGAEQQAADDRHRIERHVMHFSDASRYQPLHPLVGIGTGQGLNRAQMVKRRFAAVFKSMHGFKFMSVLNR